MRYRTVLMLMALVLLGAFVALNWGELSRTTVLNMGVFQTQGPLGLVMLGLLLIVAAVFLAYATLIQATLLMESRAHGKEIRAQRELADRAEASRFTELRALLEQMREQESARAQEQLLTLQQRIDALQSALAGKIDTSGNTLAAYIGEVEDRLERSGAAPRKSAD